MTRERYQTQMAFIWHDEAGLLARLSEQQSRLVSDTLARAARADRVASENKRLNHDLTGARAALDGSLDRLREVHHRVRNHLQILTGLLSAEEVSEASPTARQALRKSIARITSVAAIHDLLAREPRSGELRLPDLARRLSQHLISQAGAEHRLQVQLDVAPVDLTEYQATAFVLILTELLSNSIEHGFPGAAAGEIKVTVANVAGSAVLEISDNGRGLPAGFDFANTESLGLTLVSRLAERDLSGRAEAWNDDGARFRVSFPVAAHGSQVAAGSPR